MKKLLLKLATISLITILALGTMACTYRAEGSVIQEVTFKVSCQDKEDINVTAKLYKTFAPKTCDAILDNIKDGFYNDSAVVVDKFANYLVLGSFDYTDSKYVEKIYTGSTVKGEFKANGRESKLTAAAGSLVLLREPDTGKGKAKYDSGKASIAILLEESNEISNEYFCVFGKIDSEALTALQELTADVIKDSDGDMRVRYIGDRNETTDLLELGENNLYKGGIEFYLNQDDSEIKDLNKAVIEEKIDEVENELYTKLTDANYLDLYVLPTSVIKVSNFKVK